MIGGMNASDAARTVPFARLALLAVSACVFSACTSAPTAVNDARPRQAEEVSFGKNIRPQRNDERYTPIQNAITEGAHKLLGARDKISVNGERFNADCSGTMLAIFYAAGLDLRPGFNRAKGNTGVQRLYSLMESAGLLDDTDTPQPGSLVFWDDTYDRNGDGKKNDPLSHVGLVVSADREGNLTYVHYHYRNGIVEEHMNLREPGVAIKKSGDVDVIVNSPLRMRSWKPDSASLAGELYRIGARSYEYEDAGTRLGLAD